MGTSSTNRIIHYLHKLAQRDVTGQTDEGLTDGELLTAFVQRRGNDALAVLVERHGPMVWGVCRRLLGNEHDAEDAFQSVFLVLVRKATTIRVCDRGLVGNWLYGVAHQTAVRVRATRAKQYRREQQVTDLPEPAAKDVAAENDLLTHLDRELSSLPDKYRAVIILCDLEGKSRKEAARELGCPEGTVGGRLARARALLADRLARRGLAVSGGVLIAALSETAAWANIPVGVMTTTIKTASLFAVGKSAGLISIRVTTLTKEVLKVMLLQKLEATTALVLVLGMVGLGAGLIGHRSAAAEPGGIGPTLLALQNPSGKGSRSQTVGRKDAPFEVYTGRLVAIGPEGLGAAPVPPKSIAVQFEMDEHSYLRYQKLLLSGKVKGAGEPLAIGLSDENNFLHAGKLDYFDKEFNPTTGTIGVHGVLPNADGVLLPGMFVRVRMNFGPADQPKNEPAAKELQVLTPEEAVKQNSEVKVTVEFKVKSAKKGTNPAFVPEGEEYNTIDLIYSDKFYVHLRGKAVTQIYRLDIEPSEFFKDKVVRVTGNVFAYDAADKDTPYYMVVKSLDDFEVVRKK